MFKLAQRRVVFLRRHFGRVSTRRAWGSEEVRWAPRFSTKSKGKTGTGKDKGGDSVDPPRDLPKGTFTLKWVLSGGPGGQNVNKVNTKAELRMSTNAGARNIAWLPESVRQRLVSGKAKNRINADGELVIHNAETRKARSNGERAEVGRALGSGQGLGWGGAGDEPKSLEMKLRLQLRLRLTTYLPPSPPPHSPQRLLLSMIHEAWPEPKERNTYVGPSKAEKKRRVQFKRKRQEVKSLRKGGRRSDDY